MVSEPSTNVMSGSSSTSSLSLDFPTLSDITLPNYNFPFKLEHDNYVIWRSQILPAIIGANMELFLDDNTTPPAKTVTEVLTIDNKSVTRVTPNPHFQQWRRLDQALLGWLLSSISKDIHTQVTKVSVSLTSSQLWSSLEKLFGSQSRAKLMQLKIQFQTTKKDSLTISSYFCKLKEIVDGLTLAGHIISNEDFVLQLLAGLPLEYDAVVAMVNSSHTTMEPEEVQSLLLSQESRIQQATPEVTVSANYADKSQQKNENSSNNRGFNNFANNRGGTNGRGRGRRGRGRGWNNNNNRLFCQLCGKPGHVAFKCFYRFDQNFQGQSSNNNNAYFGAFPDVSANPEWLLDSGATNHITSDPSNIHYKNEYLAGEKLTVGNG